MNNQKIFLITLIALISLCGSATAQTIKGSVKDREGGALLGASVWWAGTTVGTSTDTEGGFQLHQVSEYDHLVASFVWYVNDTISVHNMNQQVAFHLTLDGLHM